MNYLLTFNVNWADEHYVPALACMNKEEYTTWCKALNLRHPENEGSEEEDEGEEGIIPTARLGNGGQNFDRKFEECHTGQDFINKGFVKVTEVSEEFKKSFKIARLDRLSLCHLFKLQED